MKRVFTILIVLSFTAFGWAQQEQGASFTLEQCIQYALDNSIAAKNAEMEQQIAKAKVKETVGIGLPQISGSASVVHNQQLGRFFATYATAQGFAGKDENGNQNLDIPGVQPTDIVASPNFFQLKSSGNASLSINQILFNGSYLVGLQASKTYKELSAKAALQTTENIIQQVKKAYYAVLINKERTQLFDNNIARVDSLLRNTTLLNQNGFAEGIDVDRVRVTLNNLRAERDKFINLNELGIQFLKFQMNYPQEKPLEVGGHIQDVEIDTNSNGDSENFDYRIRSDYQVLEVNKRLQELNIKNQYATNVPSINAFAVLGYSTQSPNVNGIFKTNTAIKDNGSIGPDSWYGSSQFGVSLDIPIFSGLQRHYRIQQEKLKLIQVTNGFTSLKYGIDLEVKQASVNFDNALKSLVAQKENQELAANIARVTKIKYEQGVGSSLEVTDAENSLRTSQTNYYSALFDAMVAKVDLDKAYGRLLPAATTTNK